MISFPQDSSFIYYTELLFPVILVSSLFFCMRYDLILAPEKELVAFSSVFQGCHLIRPPSMSETLRCQVEKNTCKPCQSLNMQLTAATWIKAQLRAKPGLLLLPSAAPREDGVFCPRHILPDNKVRVKEEKPQVVITDLEVKAALVDSVLCPLP